MSLTNRLLLLAALIVVNTTLLLVLTSAVGVYDMVLKQERARQQAYRDILAAEVGGRLEAAHRVTQAAAQRLPGTGDDPQAVRALLTEVTLQGAEYLEGMVLVRDGESVVAWPRELATAGLPASVAAAAAEAGRELRVVVVRDGQEKRTSVWLVVPAGSIGPEGLAIAARLRTSAIEDVFADVSGFAGDPVAVVLGSDGTPLFVSDARRVSGAVFSFAPAGAVVSAELTNAGRDGSYRGYYVEISRPADVGWRVAVLEPAGLALSEMWEAVRPGVVGWVAAVAVAVLAALLVVRWVAQPIRELERRARSLAAGAPLEPLTVGERDEIGRLLDAFNSVEARLNRLSDITELLARASDRALVLEGITSSIAHMLGEVDVDVALLTDDGRLEVVAAHGTLAGREGTVLSVEDAPLLVEALQLGEPVAVTAGPGDPLLVLRGGPDSAEVLAAPLRAGTDIIGVVVVIRPAGTPFMPRESETVRSFAAQASVALQNWRLFEDERRSRREAEVLRAIAERVAAPVDSLLAVAPVLADVARMEADLLGFEEAAVVLRQRATRESSEAGAADADALWLAAWDASVAAGHSPDAPLVVSREDPGDAATAAVLSQGVRVALFTPLARGNEQAGLIVLASRHDRVPLGPAQLELASAVSKQASLALQNAHLYEQARSRADNLETIFRISHAVGSSLQSRIVLNRVLDVVQKILSADAVMLMTYDAKRKVISVPMARGILHRDMLTSTFRPGEDVPGRVFETREPERFDRIGSGSVGSPLLAAAAEQGLESLLCVPLLARGRSIGVLAVFSRVAAAFTPEDLDLLRTFASQAALAIDTAELFSREHHVATVLQESIIPPRLPRFPGIDAASVYLPAGAEAEIGGDYYDLFMAPDGRVVATIGDVCGKGVVAATKTSMIKYAIRGMVAAGLGPARVLEELNGMLAAGGDPSNIVTLWIGYLDASDGTLVFANAGHPPAQLLDPSTKRVTRLGTTGPLLGAVETASWDEERTRLEHGGALLLYTDGVTEARTGSRFFGEGRVRRVLRSGGSANAILERLLRLVQRFAQGQLRDDAAILVIERTSPEGG